MSLALIRLILWTLLCLSHPALSHAFALDERGALTGLDDGSAVEPVRRDESGAVTELHGREIYRDWLGRPVLALNAAGDAVFAVRYDGFGRVAQRRAPWPTDATKQRIESSEYTKSTILRYGHRHDKSYRGPRTGSGA